MRSSSLGRASSTSTAVHVASVLAAALFMAASGLARIPPKAAARPTRTTQATPPSIVLVTLDTTRADHLGCYGDRAAHTPVLDALAARGTRWARALSPVPLTLPAHCSLLTGREPPEHGVRDNGTHVLPAEIPTLATVLSSRGYATGAFVSSRVLDRRFGLARGFGLYDDRMAAERVGEYGYPERDAEAVTTAALAWAQQRSRSAAARPYFLWIHYYDPHSPYTAPREFADLAKGQPNAGYAAEIAYVDRQLGRLLAGLPGDPARRIVAVVGDHGESLGEHGERAHGLFLYRGALEVPLIVAGPGAPAGKVVAEPAATRRLAASLLRLAGAGAVARTWGRGLPGLPGEDTSAEPVYSETWMPASAYNWSPLQALTEGRWRLVVAPRPEVYDFVADPGEKKNLLAEPAGREAARRLRRLLKEREAAWKVREAAAPMPDAELAASLRSLGYLSGTSRSGASRAGGPGIDPKDGILLLGELDQAKALTAKGNFRSAAEKLSDLVRRSPGNVPFLVQLASAQGQSGQGDAALATYRRAVEANPALDFLHLDLAGALKELGRTAEAKAEYEFALKLNPRFAPAWLGLAELDLVAGKSDQALTTLRRAIDAGTESASLYTHLAELAGAAGDSAAAEKALAAATTLLPGWSPAWKRWGERAEAAGDLDTAQTRYRKAVAADPGDPEALLDLGRLLLKKGSPADARAYLEKAAAAAPQSDAGREARRLLAGGR